MIGYSGKRKKPNRKFLLLQHAPAAGEAKTKIKPKKSTQKRTNNENSFASFFNHVDNLPKDTFLYITSAGMRIVQMPSASLSGDQKRDLAAVESEAESEENKDNDEEGG